MLALQCWFGADSITGAGSRSEGPGPKLLSCGLIQTPIGRCLGYDAIEKDRMMEADIAGFITVGLVVAFIAGQVFKTLRAFAAQKTVREAISRGTPVTPEMLVEAERSAEPGANDMRNGMVLIALALAIAGFGVLQNSAD